MQRKGVIFLFLLLCTSISNVLSGDDKKIESLRQIIHHGKDNIAIVGALFSLSDIYRDLGKYDSAAAFAVKALDLSNLNGYTRGIAESHYRISLACVNQRLYKEAIDENRKFLATATSIGDDELLRRGYSLNGRLFNGSNQADSSFHYIQASIALDHKLHDSVGLMKDYNTLGYTYRNLAIPDSALVYCLKAARIAEILDDQLFLGEVCFYIGQILFKMEAFEDSKGYIEKSLAIAQQNNDLRMVSDCLAQIGLTYSHMEDYHQGIKYLDQAALVSRAVGDTSPFDLNYDYYAYAYLELGNYTKALEMIDKMLVAYPNKNYGRRIIFDYKVKGEVLTKLGRYMQAGEALDSGINLAAKYKDPIAMEWILHSSAKNLFSSGAFKEAYLELDKYWKLHDSVYNDQKDKIIFGLKQQYEKERDVSKILALEKENLAKTLQRNSSLYFSLALIMVGIYGYMILRHRWIRLRMLNQQKLKEMEEKEKLLAAGKLLEGQEEERKRIALDLHDGLGVVLSATKMQFTAFRDSHDIDPKLVDKAIGLLEHATGEVRRISHNMMPGLLTKLGLFEAIEDLVENLNDTGNIKAGITIEGKKIRLPENIEIMVYRIIQEMINNTIKYARADHLDLVVKVSNPSITINYKDDGVGFDMESVMSPGNPSLGLKSISSRVGFLNGEMKITSSPGSGVSYWIKIPYKPDMAT